MLVQLDPVISIETPRGKGVAHYLINSSGKKDYSWLVLIEETGEFWSFLNSEIKSYKRKLMRQRFKLQHALKPRKKLASSAAPSMLTSRVQTPPTSPTSIAS